MPTPIRVRVLRAGGRWDAMGSRLAVLSVSSSVGPEACSTGAGTGGYRIIIKGYEYTAQMIAQLAGGWNNAYNVTTLRRQTQGNKPLQGSFAPAGPLAFGTWTSYPGGPTQGGQKINPYWHFAFNNQATDASRQYVFSNNTNVGGGSNQVEDPEQDLAILANSGNALWVKGWGVKGVPLPPGQTGSPGTPGQNLARAGWFINGTETPEQTGGAAGIYVTQNVNPLTFGLRPGATNEYDPVPALAGELLFFGDNAVPMVGANGSAIPADQVVVGYDGVLVEQAAS